MASLERTEESNVSYTPSESLEETKQEVTIILALLHSNDWKNEFLALDQLRALLKFRWDEFLVNWPLAHTKVLELTDSPRSNLSKNALMLFTDCFQGAHSGIEELIVQALPVLFIKATNDKTFIKTEALAALTVLSTVYSGSFLAYQLVEYCFHRATNICELAFDKLTVILRTLPQEEAFRILLRLLDCKRQRILSLTEKHLSELKDNWSGFERELATLKAADREKVRLCLCCKTTQPQMSLKDFIKQKKMGNVDLK